MNCYYFVLWEICNKIWVPIFLQKLKRLIDAQDVIKWMHSFVNRTISVNFYYFVLMEICKYLMLLALHLHDNGVLIKSFKVQLYENDTVIVSV